MSLFFEEIPLIKWVIPDDDIGYFQCIIYRKEPSMAGSGNGTLSATAKIGRFIAEP